MSQDPSAKYYQVFLKKKQEKSDNMVVSDTKSARRWKTKAGWVQKKIL